jgi:hypothetical protein
MKSANAIGRGQRLRALGLWVLMAFVHPRAYGQQPAPSPLPYAPLPPLLAAVDASRLHGDSLELLDELKQTEGEIDRSNNRADQDRRLHELLFQTVEFVKFQPDSIQVWALRAVVAIELNEAYVGRDAAQELARLKASDSADPIIRDIFTALEGKNWTRPILDADQAAAAASRAHNRVSLLTASKFGSGGINQVAYNPKWNAYDAYLDRMIKSLQLQWDRILAGSRTAPTPNTWVTVKFTLDYHGMVTGIVDVGSTSNAQGEQSCLTAITLAEPFGAWTGDMITTLGISQPLTFQFYYP